MHKLQMVFKSIWCLSSCAFSTANYETIHTVFCAILIMTDPHRLAWNSIFVMPKLLHRCEWWTLLLKLWVDVVLLLQLLSVREYWVIFPPPGSGMVHSSMPGCLSFRGSIISLSAWFRKPVAVLWETPSDLQYIINC